MGRDRSVSAIWDEAGWPDYYESHRITTSEMYPSEWHFLKDLLVERVSILDVGCAVGGLATIVSEHVSQFEYTGVDISAEMIARARVRRPQHQFHVIGESDLSILADRRYDLVVCLGVLHLTRSWRQVIHDAWRHTRKHLVLDLRTTGGRTIENETASYYRMDHFRGDGSPSSLVLPYNVINSDEAANALKVICAGAAGIQHHGYASTVSAAAVTPVTQVLMSTYRIDRAVAASRID